MVRTRAAWRNAPAMGGEGGQAVVEAAFALPLTVVLILCTIQITQLQRARLLVEYASFNAARAGAVQNGNDGSDGSSGPMHDAAALSLASAQGPTDSLDALARTFAAFRAREAALRALGLPLVQVRVLNPRRGDFARLGQHLDGQEIDFDDVRPQAIDATLLSIRVRYLVELRVPLANKLIQALWLASRARAPDGLDLAALSAARGRGFHLLPVQAFQTVRMQSNPFLRWVAP